MSLEPHRPAAPGPARPAASAFTARSLHAPLHRTGQGSLGKMTGSLRVCFVLAVALAVGTCLDVPKVHLSSGGDMPIVGLGTWQVTDDQELETALDAALQAGYRHIDTATIYRNEHLIGKVLSKWLKEGKVKREELFITTKLPVYGMRAADVPDFLQQSLTKLQVDYVDLYLIHMPVGVQRHAYDMGRISENGTDLTTDHVAIWKAMEAEHKAGRAKALGVSNFNETQIERLLKQAVPPSNLQVELHLYHQQRPLVDFCKQHGVSVTAYSPLGSPGSKWLSLLSGKELPDLLGLPVVKEIAAKHNKTSAQVLLKHTVQRGIIVIPKSSKPNRIQQNIDIFDFTLDDSDMAKLDAQDKGLDGKLFDMKFIGGSGKHPEYPWTALLKH
ncbi:Aldo-keto reductase family 4 member C10 [Frankliniella fusca]|uniref:Aldo-keto reductase family 4 member C10 n=1 Tax=Frankliniella fusca TaxID=407009 RepID=A0AAE1HRM3_9NEOP|nr:Aldo-keto reductase family 4 member C10 [Frankliniella fusca]